MLSGHLTNADHPDCVWWNRLVVKGRVHEGTGARGRGLVVFGRHRVVSFQEGLQVKTSEVTWQNIFCTSVTCRMASVHCHIVLVQVNAKLLSDSDT